MREGSFWEWCSLPQSSPFTKATRPAKQWNSQSAEARGSEFHCCPWTRTPNGFDLTTLGRSPPLRTEEKSKVQRGDSKCVRLQPVFFLASAANLSSGYSKTVMATTALESLCTLCF